MHTTTRDRADLWRPISATAVVVVALLAASMPTLLRPARDSAPAHDAGHHHAWHRVHARAGAPAGADAALQLQGLFGQHSMFAADMMRGRIRGDEDFAQRANAALTRNTDAMGQLLEPFLGARTGRFRAVWSGHVAALFSYSRAVANADAALRDESRRALTAFERDLAGLLVEASQGRLPQQAAEATALMHVDQLLKQADAYAAKDYTTANRIYREAYAHASHAGKVIAGALLGPDQAAALDTPVFRLRSELARLLGEHVVLATTAFRTGVLNTAEFPAAGASVNANTRDLTAAVDSLFGAAAAQRFQSLWADHIDQLIEYTGGAVTNDAGRRDRAIAKLKEFEGRLAAFLESATAARLPAGTLAKALLAHDQMLLGEIDAFAAKDYQKAHDLAYTVYQHMFDLAGQLADAFGLTIAARLPVGGANTGHGGAAGAGE
jgi:hypothetical protein